MMTENLLVVECKFKVYELAFIEQLLNHGGLNIMKEMNSGNVFYMLGCPCSGKTTVGKMLSEKYDMFYVSGDGRRFH